MFWPHERREHLMVLFPEIFSRPTDCGALTVTSMRCQNPGMFWSQGFYMGSNTDHRIIGLSHSMLSTWPQVNSRHWDAGQLTSRVSRTHPSCPTDRNTWAILPSSITVTFPKFSDTDVWSYDADRWNLKLNQYTKAGWAKHRQPCLNQVPAPHPWVRSWKSTMWDPRDSATSPPSLHGSQMDERTTSYTELSLNKQKARDVSLDLVLEHMRGWNTCLPPWSWVWAKTSDNAIRKGPQTSHPCRCCNMNNPPRVP
jgi:hypothetical protein